MKQAWAKLSARIDSRTLRERALLFIAAASLLIFFVFFFFLNPSYARQKLLLADIGAKQTQMAVVAAEIAQTIDAHTRDPDAAERQRLARIQADVQALRVTLTAMQQGMVPADRMSSVLEQMLRGQRGLRLTSMRTLGEGAPAAQEPATPAPAGAAVVAAPPAQLLHKHGVELVLQGSYPDMVAYMNALEGMQGQIFWGNARMEVDKWPSATLTLTVYTINLDKKWLTL
jgi:MSHA biogenesis protein MshJ